MPKTPHSSPTLKLTIPQDQYERSVQSNSGGCLVADAIKRQFPEMTNVVVDMATIRFSDRKRGVRYTYLTPEEAQHVLLAYDQGWTNPFNEVTIKRAVVITPIVRAKKGPSSIAATTKRRATRKKELEAKVAKGQPLTAGEKRALGRVSKAKPAPKRPSTVGKADVKVDEGRHQKPVRVGGKPIVQGEAHPNLLRGRDRHFGAKMSSPGVAFEKAVEEAVTQRMAQSTK